MSCLAGEKRVTCNLRRNNTDLFSSRVVEFIQDQTRHLSSDLLSYSMNLKFPNTLYFVFGMKNFSYCDVIFFLDIFQQNKIVFYVSRFSYIPKPGVFFTSQSQYNFICIMYEKEKNVCDDTGRRWEFSFATYIANVHEHREYVISLTTCSLYLSYNYSDTTISFIGRGCVSKVAITCGR